MKKWKKLLMSFLVFVFSILAGWGMGSVNGVKAANYNGYYYGAGEEGEILIYGYSGSETDLVIPGEKDGKKVTGIVQSDLCGSGFCDRSDLTSVTIPESVTAIGEDAFSGCSGLTSITIPSGVKYIDESAFARCSGLTSITVDEKNTVYDSRGDCNAIVDTRLDTLVRGCCNTTIPNSVTGIGRWAFSGCSGLTSIVIPESVTEIGQYAFYECGDLTSITVDGKNTAFDSREDCNAIIETRTNKLICGCCNTKIPESVTRIGEHAFRGCNGLTSVTIPSGVASIEWGVFEGCSDLSSIKVDEKNTVYDSREDCNAIIETKTNTLIYGCRNTIIPESVTGIGHGAFRRCNGLTSVTIPSGVTSIGQGVFQKCSGLTSITIPDSVTSIEALTFSDCSGLTSVTIPDSVTSIEWCAFEKCSGLTSITIPSGVTSIEWSAFEGCSGLTSITIPDSVTDIKSYAFGKCSSLTSITIPDSVTSIDSDAFYGCSDDLVIWTTRSSYADNYAKENGITVKYIGEPEEPAPTPAAPQPPAQVQPQPQSPGTGTTPAKESKKPTKSSLAIKGGAKAKAGKKKLTLAWKKVANASGYEIQISLKKNFKGAKKQYVKGAKKNITIKQLKSGTVYYIRIRAYTEQNGKKIYGKWTVSKQRVK